VNKADSIFVHILELPTPESPPRTAEDIRWNGILDTRFTYHPFANKAKQEQERTARQHYGGPSYGRWVNSLLWGCNIFCYSQKGSCSRLRIGMGFRSKTKFDCSTPGLRLGTNILYSSRKHPNQDHQYRLYTISGYAACDPRVTCIDRPPENAASCASVIRREVNLITDMTTGSFSSDSLPGCRYPVRAA